MKKITTIIIITIVLAANLALSAGMAFAQAAPNLFQPVSGPAGSKLTLVGNLPRSDWTTMMGSIIQLVLAITGSLAFASFTYGGVLMVTAQGKDEQISKGKSILLWSVLALVIIAASYGIVIGISRLKFFQ